jgi:hypothetical protein
MINRTYYNIDDELMYWHLVDGLKNVCEGYRMKKFKYQSRDVSVVREIICNKCGEIIAKETDCNKVDYISINKTWGYFSNKDNENHTIDICEKCYDEWIKTFKIPPTIKQNSEVI